MYRLYKRKEKILKIRQEVWSYKQNHIDIAEVSTDSDMFFTGAGAVTSLVTSVRENPRHREEKYM
jgi:hypothetical protein